MEEEINYNKKVGITIKKELYDMHDGIPIWKHLINNGHENYLKIVGHDYGRMAEVLGVRELNRIVEPYGFIDNIFPGITILSTSRRTKGGKNHKEYGDYGLEIHYKKIINMERK